jgi:hypothetical protein
MSDLVGRIDAETRGLDMTTGFIVVSATLLAECRDELAAKDAEIERLRMLVRATRGDFNDPNPGAPAMDAGYDRGGAS